MKRILLAGFTAFAFASTAYAGDLNVPEAEIAPAPNFKVGPIVTGSIEVEVAENSAGDYAATTTFEAGLMAPGLAFGEIGVESVDGTTFEVNKWYLGTMIGTNSYVSFGDHDGGVFVESYSDYSTISDPVINEALILGVGDAAVAVGFTDITTDIADVSNIQGAYNMDLGLMASTVSADYNFDSDEYALGLRSEGLKIGGLDLGSTVSYQSLNKVFAYELDATVISSLTVYVNGDNDDALRNVGAGYERDIGGLLFNADINYDIDAKDFTPTAGVTFMF